MGGKNAGIIFDDVDLSKCIPVLLRYNKKKIFF
jgi:hypothetical protein